MIKAIVFDFDGTIIDTETAWYQAFREAYLEHGIELTLDMYSGCIGTSLHQFNPYEYLVTELHLPIDLDAFRRSIHARHAEIMATEEIRPGISEYLQSAKAAGLKIGLASSSARTWVDKYIHHLGLAHYFEVIRTSDDVKKVKPDPALYQQATDALGIDGSQAIAIEDSPNGAKAAVQAGLYTVVVPNSITKLLRFEKTHVWKESLSELSFEELLSGVNMERRLVQ